MPEGHLIYRPGKVPGALPTPYRQMRVCSVPHRQGAPSTKINPAPICPLQYDHWPLLATSGDNSVFLISLTRPPTVIHAWHDVAPGKDVPRDFQAVIEIPLGSNVKYELDKPTGLLKVDRIIHSAVFYPANYGFIPQTYAEDNDPLDVLVLCQEPVQPLSLIQARAIGLMTMIDSGASDDKIIAVATNDPEFSGYVEAKELPPHRLLVLKRFFQDYKQLEGKQVQVEDIRPAYAAVNVIEKALARYKENRSALRGKTE